MLLNFSTNFLFITQKKATYLALVFFFQCARRVSACLIPSNCCNEQRILMNIHVLTPWTEFPFWLQHFYKSHWPFCSCCRQHFVNVWFWSMKRVYHMGDMAIGYIYPKSHLEIIQLTVTEKNENLLMHLENGFRFL